MSGRKVLIASVGNPRNQKTGEYRMADYFLTNNPAKTFQSSYTIEALTKLKCVDKLILIGTAGSDWFALYYYLCKMQNILVSPVTDFDEGYAKELLALGLDPNRRDRDPVEVERSLEQLRDGFDPRLDTDIILMRYGLTEQEWDENFRLLRRIEERLEGGDELILDTTHSFRSLPVFQMLSVFYFQHVSGKEIKLNMLSYGMFEATSECGDKTPIIDMKCLAEMMEYIQAANEYKRFGTTYSIDKLISSRNDAMRGGLSREEWRIFGRLSDVASINDIKTFRKIVEWCHEQNDGVIAEDNELELLADSIFKDIDDLFYDDLADEILTQFHLARWHYDKKRYLCAVTTARENCITFVMQLCGERPEVIDNSPKRRDDYNDALKMLNSHGHEACVKFNSIRRELFVLRNELAHLPDDGKTYEERIRQLDQLLKQIQCAYVGYFTPAEIGSEAAQANRNALRDAVLGSM